jgi:altronate dehydratase small subunit
LSILLCWVTDRIVHPTVFRAEQIRPMSLALCIRRNDNVATLLDDASPSPVSLLGESPQSTVTAIEPIARGHKIALVPIAAGEAVVKFGVTIGRATSDIPAGAWVHTHNCASPLDPRSATLDRNTGAPTDTIYD